MSTTSDHLSCRTIAKAAVLGAGAWGTALAIALSRSGLDVSLWSRRAEHARAMRAEGQNRERLSGCAFPPGLTPTGSMAEALAAADVILLAAPSKAVVSLSEAARAHARADTPALICAKGLGEQGALLSDEVRRVWDGPVPAPSGLCFADEVANDLPTIVTLAGPMPMAARMADQLSGPRFVLCPSGDLTGVQVAGVFKNVAATLCGVSDGIGLGVNARAALMSEAMREAACVIRALGGSVETLLGPAGFGDFALTCTDAKSRNYSFGRALGQGAVGGVGVTREGAANVAALLRLARRLGTDAQLACALADLLAGKLDARAAIEAAFAWRREQALEAVRAA